MNTSYKQRSGEVSGPLVIAIMFAFASIATGILWFYWYYHSAPFAPLQKAIAEEFRLSAARVDGGQRRMHKDSPRLLWIVLRVDFQPDEGEASLSAVGRIADLAEKHVDLASYDQLNVRLFIGEPEKYLHKQDYKIPIIDGTRGIPSLLDDAANEAAGPNPVRSS
jgi:hypothetical protein